MAIIKAHIGEPNCQVELSGIEAYLRSDMEHVNRPQRPTTTKSSIGRDYSLTSFGTIHENIAC